MSTRSIGEKLVLIYTLCLFVYIPEYIHVVIFFIIYIRVLVVMNRIQKHSQFSSAYFAWESCVAMKKTIDVCISNRYYITVYTAVIDYKTKIRLEL